MIAFIIAAAVTAGSTPGAAGTATTWMLVQVFVVCCLTFGSLVWFAKTKR